MQIRLLYISVIVYYNVYYVGKMFMLDVFLGEKTTSGWTLGEFTQGADDCWQCSVSNFVVNFWNF